jgi:two-component system chemotaxis response regulator CheB
MLLLLPVARRNIFVIGASAGGFLPLQMLIAHLEPRFPAALYAVIHGPEGRPELPEVLAAQTQLPVRFGQESEPIQPGVLVLAPPDRHLLVKENEIRVTRGARENLWRPSIDVLFRSAAVAHGSRVTGIVLSGALDDGTCGSAAICACGGAVMAQEPTEAEFPSMPASVLRNLDGIRVLRSADLPHALERLVEEPAGPPREVPETLRIEAGFAEDPMAHLQDYPKLGELSQNTCPECGGPLRRAPGRILRFRCHTGHAFSAPVLEERTRCDVESSLWSAIRLFQQRANLDRGLAQKEIERGRLQGADKYATRAAEATAHASVLHDLLMKLPD